jgi:ParB/RepB/Spo0J family partition protein
MSIPPATAQSMVDAMAEQALTSDGVYGQYELAKIRKSPDNRKRFSETGLQELAESIKAVGVAQPILIRPVPPTAEAPEEFEIVAGERRYRGSIIAGKTTIPAVCRILSDLDAAKLRILENLQREDPHPMEEAEGYQLLMLQHGYTADQLVDEVKKSRAYIYARLKLCALANEVRGQFLDNKLSASTALLIARIPVPALQVKAAQEILNPYGSGSEPMSHRAAASHIQNRYMLKLSTAIFATTDAKLLATAGACTKCPKRTGNQPEIFEGIDANVCTDPDCFAEKRAAHGAALLVQANKQGIPVLEGEEASQTLSRRWNSSESELVTADMGLWYYRRNAPSTKNNGDVKDYLTEDTLPTVASYAKRDDGSLTPLYKRGDIQAALEAVGACETVEAHEERMNAAMAANPAATAKEDAEQKKRQEREALVTRENGYRLALYKQLRQRASVAGLSLPSLREFAKAVVQEHDLDSSLHDLYESDVSTDLDGYIDNADAGALQMLLIDVMLGRLLEIGVYDLMHDGSIDEDDGFATVVAMARNEGVDVDAVRANAFSPAAPAVVDEPAAPEDEAPIASDQVVPAIDVSGMQYDDLVEFFKAHPGRINELKEAVLHCVSRYDLVSLLETAANSLGYVHQVGGFVQRPSVVAAQVDQMDTDEAPAAAGADTAASPAVEEPCAGSDAAQAEPQSNPVADFDEAEDLAEQVTTAETVKQSAKQAKTKASQAKPTAKATPAPVKATKVATAKTSKAAPKAAVKPADAWPFPRSSDGKREAAAPAPAEAAP